MLFKATESAISLIIKDKNNVSNGLIKQLGKYQLWLSNGKYKTSFVILAVLFCFNALYIALFTVPSDSVAIVLRFGKFSTILPSALHFKLPLGIDRVHIVPIKRQLKQEFGFSTPGATDPNQNVTINNNIFFTGKRRDVQLRNQLGEMQMLTGDLNTALVEWVILPVPCAMYQNR